MKNFTESIYVSSMKKREETLKLKNTTESKRRYTMNIHLYNIRYNLLFVKVVFLV